MLVFAEPEPEPEPEPDRDRAGRAPPDPSARLNGSMVSGAGSAVDTANTPANASTSRHALAAPHG